MTMTALCCCCFHFSISIADIAANSKLHFETTLLMMAGRERNWCFNKSCPANRGNAAPTNLLKCLRCKTASYCGAACQKKDWGFHKHKCVPSNVPRHEVESFTIASIQKAINEANPGDTVQLKEGTYEAPDDKTWSTLFIDKPLKLWGSEKVMVKKCGLCIKPSGSDGDSDGVIVVADITFHGNSNIISSNVYKSVTLYNVRLMCPATGREDALVINDCKGKCLLLDCGIYGGSDSVFISSERVHLKRCEIQYAQSRGIFSRRDFTIEDCTISDCGGYGIKGTAGWTEKGRNNNIQPGPWSEFGGASDGYGGMGMW